jgi:predicted alpha/beta hydrolase
MKKIGAISRALCDITGETNDFCCAARQGAAEIELALSIPIFFASHDDPQFCSLISQRSYADYVRFARIYDRFGIQIARFLIAIGF